MSTKLKNLFLASIIVASTLVSVFSVTPALAKTNAEMTPREQAMSYSYYFALAECIDQPSLAREISASNGLSPTSWFSGADGSTGTREVAVGHLIDPEDGVRDCRNLITSALNLWGYAGDYSRALRDFGYTLDGDGNYIRPSNLQDKYRSAIKAKVYAGSSPVLNSAALYQRAFLSFVNGCKATSVGEFSKLTEGQRALVNDPKHYKVTVVSASPDGKSAVKTDYLYKAEYEKTRAITMFEKDGGGRESDQCQTLAGDTTRYADGYLDYAKNHIANGGTLEPTTLATANPGDKEVCNLTGVGWIVCPVAYLLAGITDQAYKFIANMLEFTPTVQAFDTQNPVYQIWSAIRNIANVAFVFAFFFIIFSQATSIGIGSYGIKKMLPRLIVAAILVNLSYFICMFAVDMANIVGTFIYSAIRSVLDGVSTPDEATWSSTITGILTGGAIILGAGAAIAASGPILGTLAAALPFLVIALFAIITALLVLIARQALIVILVIIAPLAFVAYILPNTEDLFNKWRKLFTTLLIFFPLVAIVFAGSAVAAEVVRLTFTTGSVEDDVAAQFARIGSLAIQAFPLFALPFLLKFSGGVLGRLGAVINNPNKGPFDSLRKKAEETRDIAQADRRRRAMESGSRYNPTAVMARRSARHRARLESSKSNLNAATSSYIADEALNNDGKFARQLAGGRTATDSTLQRAMSSAVTVQRKSEAEDLSNARQLLSFNATQAGMTAKDFSKQVAESRAGANNLDIKDTRGKTVSTLPHVTPGMYEAALDTAAENGEVQLFEKLRMRSAATPEATRNEQAMLDKVIERNSGTFKGKGGFHLATDFELAAGRTKPGSADMAKARLESLAGTSATAISGMKFSQVINVSETLKTSEGMAAFNALDPGAQQAIKISLSEALNDPNTRATVTDRLQYLTSMADRLQVDYPVELRSQGGGPTPPPNP